VVVGLFFGSSEGNTQAVAHRIASRFEPESFSIVDISDVTQNDLYACDGLILGISTWDFGQIQSDWEAFWPDLEAMDFSGKTVALYGLGDQFGYGDFFLDAMGLLHDLLLERGAHCVGYWPVEGYHFDASKALTPDGTQFVGLALDEDQQPDLTDARLDVWCAAIAQDLGLTLKRI
jgi:flavodoxin I